MTDAADVERLVRAMNDAWREGRYEDLHSYFDESAALLPPGSADPIVGADEIVDSYRQFGDAGTLHRFDITNVDVFDYDGIVMCHLTFEVDYEIDSGRFTERGLEVYVIRTSGPAPKIVWRTQLPFPKS